MYRLHVPKMRCGGCVATITDAVTALDPAARVEADIAARTVSIDSEKTQEEIVMAMTEAGYPPQEA
jgi:copper chaperone